MSYLRNISEEIVRVHLRRRSLEALEGMDEDSKITYNEDEMPRKSMLQETLLDLDHELDQLLDDFVKEYENNDFYTDKPESQGPITILGVEDGDQPESDYFESYQDLPGL